MRYVSGMGYRSPDTLHYVRMPKLRGEFYFAILGGAGYAYGALARTPHAFEQTATALFLDGMVNPAFGPVRCRIVAPSPEMVELLKRQYEEAQAHEYTQWLTSRVGRYVSALHRAPPGFKRVRAGTKKNCVEDLNGCYRWVGEGPLTKFREQMPPEAPTPEAPTSGPSVAEAVTPESRSLFYVTGGDSGTWETNVRAHDFKPSWSFLSDTPAFFAETLEHLPDLLVAPAQTHAKVIDERKAREAETRKERDRACEAERVAEREALLALFGG